MVEDKVRNQAFQVSSSLSTPTIQFVPKARNSNHCKILDGFLYFASLFGSFPAFNILGDHYYLEFRWLHPVTIWSAVVGTVSLIVGMDFIFVGFPVFAKLVYGGTLNTLIQGHVRHYNYLAGERIKRACSLWHCREIIELVNSIRTLHQKIDEVNQDRAMKQLATGNNQVLKLKRFNPWVLHLIFFITLGCNAMNLVYRIEVVFSPSVDEFVKTVKYVVLPSAAWGVRLFWLWNHCFSFVSLIFTYGIVTLIGIQLITIYVNFKNILLVRLHDMQSESGKEISCLKPEMLLMMKSFEKFCRFGGTFALIAVCSATIAVAEYVYSAALTGAISSVAGLIAAAVNLIAIIAVGEAMEWEILRGREQIQDALMDVPNGAVTCESLRQVLQRFGNWSWKLTGKNVFVINNKLITRIFGSVVTFLIFMFQLRFAETSPGANLSAPSNNPSPITQQVL